MEDEAGNATDRIVRVLTEAGHQAHFSHFGADVKADVFEKLDGDNVYRVEVRVEGELDDEGKTEVVGCLNPYSSGVPNPKQRRGGYDLTAQVRQDDPDHDRKVVALVATFRQVARDGHYAAMVERLRQADA